MPRIRQDKTNNRFVYLLLCLSNIKTEKPMTDDER